MGFARISEGSWSSRSTRFDAGDPRIVFDNFPGGNGNLVGRAAVIGGIWLDSPDISTHSSPVVVANKATTVATVTGAAIAGTTLSPSQFLEDWYIRMLVTPTAQEADFKVVGAWFGQQDPEYYGILFTCQTGTGAPGQIEIVAGSFTGTPLVIDTTVTLGTAHEIVLNYLAADQSIHVLVDDVEVGTMAATPPPGGNTRVFTLYANVGAVVALPTFSEIEMGTGTYA